MIVLKRVMVALVTLVGVSGCQSDSAPTSSTAAASESSTRSPSSPTTPAASGGAAAARTAQAAQVVIRAHAYLDALVQGDCDAARAMVTNSIEPWCRAPKVNAYEITGSPMWSTAGAGSALEWCVPTRITISSSDVSLPDGTHTWSYCFAEVNGAWMLSSQGQG